MVAIATFAFAALTAARPAPYPVPGTSTAPYPMSGNSSSPFASGSGTAVASTGLMPRATGSSSGSNCTPGQMVCSSDGTQFGLCGPGGVVFQATAPGTSCVGGAIVDGSGSGSGFSAAGSASAAPAAPSPAAPVASSAMPSAPVSSAPAAAGSAIPTLTGMGSAPAPSSSDSAASPSGSLAAAAPSSPTISNSTSPSVDSSSSAASPLAGGKYGKVYTGDGSPSAGWPTRSQWLSFEQLWQLNQPIIQTGCMAFNAPNNSPEMISQLKQAILSTSQQSGISSAFALAIALQESNACLFVKTTSLTNANPGIYQSHAGKGTCSGQQTCPKAMVDLQVQDGIAGTAAGPGLAQLYKQATGTGAQKYYQAARMYNSGSVASDNNLDDGQGATNCYSPDVANRLLGWSSGTTGCTL